MNPRVNDAALVLRLTLAGVIVFYGCRNLFGWFDGPGIAVALTHYDATPGIPRVVSLFLLIFEYCCGAGVLLGFLTRLSAAGIGMIAITALAVTVLPETAGTEFGMRVVTLGMCCALLLTGAGSFSIDRILRKRYGNEGLAGRLMG